MATQVSQVNLLALPQHCSHIHCKLVELVQVYSAIILIQDTSLNWVSRRKKDLIFYSIDPVRLTHIQICFNGAKTNSVDTSIHSNLFLLSNTHFNRTQYTFANYVSVLTKACAEKKICLLDIDTKL